VVKRYAPETNPLKMKPMIESVLSVKKWGAYHAKSEKSAI
jgi:hypothetical protein